MPYQMGATAVTLNDLEGHLSVAGLFKCNPSNIYAVFYMISTDGVLAVPLRQLSFFYESGNYRQEQFMLETWKVDNNKIRKEGAFRKPTSIRYVTGTRYLENIPEVQVCRSSLVSK